MEKYGEAAKSAAIYARDDRTSPVDAWEKAMKDAFPNQPSARDKGCPKGAFLGLCEAGVVKDIPPGEYTRSKKNKAYARAALSLLQKNPTLARNPKHLWEKSQADPKKQHNQQMDVVIALFNAGLLE